MELKQPIISPSAFIAEGAIVKGNVQIGDNTSIWFNSTVRADFAEIIIGADTNIQDNCVVHVEVGSKVHIGDKVTVGHGAIVHGCTVKNNSLIGMGSIILNDVIIGENCIIGAGTLITQNTIIPNNSLVLGNPGKVVRELTLEEIETNKKNAQHYVQQAQLYRV